MEMSLVFNCPHRFDVPMKLSLCLFALFMSIATAFAAELQITGPQIQEQLSGNAFQQIKPTTQHKIEQLFLRGGATQFVVDGQVQLGQWKVEGDKYCSAWPPSDNWECYDILQDGTTLIFLSARGARYIMVPASP